MKKVTDYVEVGEMCEAPDGTVLKCVEDEDHGCVPCACAECWYGHKDCSLIRCKRHDREDDNNVHFEPVNT